jgi:formylglycine-generating enzyme required for sulfatase activity
MSGNVMEWCLNELEKPKKVEVSGSERRVVRGGSWYNHSNFARAADRSNSNPNYRYNNIGFRLCCASPIF